jgi:hypothetical protein
MRLFGVSKLNSKADVGDSGNERSILQCRWAIPLYVMMSVFFLFIVRLHQIGYQDAWILDGILLPTVLFIFISFVVQMFLPDPGLVALVGAIFSFVIYLIPGLKYELFYGTYDSVAHYGFAESLISSGHVPTVGYYAQYYSRTPNIHLLLGSFSLVSGLSLNTVFKLIVPAIWAIVPLVVYLVTKGLFDKAMQKYIIIASTLPAMGVLGYTVSGSTFGTVVYFLFLAILLHGAFASSSKKEYSLILMVLAFSLITYHGVTSLLLLCVLIGITLGIRLLRISYSKPSRRSLIYDFIMASTFFAVLLMVWWSFEATSFLESFSGIVREIFSPEKVVGVIPARFFQIPLFAQLRVLVVNYVNDAILGIMTFLGLFVFLRKSRERELASAKTLYIILLMIFAIISAIVVFQFATNFGGIEYERFILDAMILSPFLVGLALWNFDRHVARVIHNDTFKSLIVGSAISLLFSVCLLSVFQFQPLIPQANVLSKNLPDNEYLMDTRMVNTVYQKQMISFAERFSRGDALIDSDAVTMYQTFGFAPSLFSRQTWSDPLQPNWNQTKEWDLLLLHGGDRAASFSERAEYHTEEIINHLRSIGNLVYDNGESFIVANIKNP